MAAKKQSAAQVKAAKQKKLAIGGAVLLVGVLVIQGPKMLKMLSGGSSAAPAPAVAPVPVAPVPGATPATPATPTPAQPSGTKLVSFERFSSKDPFSAQVSTSAPSAATGSTGTAAAATATATGTGGAAVTLVPKTTSSSSSSTVKPTVKKTSMEIIQGNGSAKITVNGRTETVSRSKDFPKSDPTFTLADVNASAQSVTVSIAGGSLKTGGKTFTLYTGAPKTLLNTADGKRYTLTLVSVQAP